MNLINKTPIKESKTISDTLILLNLGYRIIWQRKRIPLGHFVHGRTKIGFSIWIGSNFNMNTIGSWMVLTHGFTKGKTI